MTAAGGESQVSHTLSAAESERLLAAAIGASTDPLNAPRETVHAVANALNAKVALLGKDEQIWSVLIEAGGGPPVLALAPEVSRIADRIADEAHVQVQAIVIDEHPRTFVRLSRRAGAAALLMLEGDWSASASTLVEIAHHLLFAERAYALARQARVRVAVHRFARKLAARAGLPAVSKLALDCMTKIVRAQIGSLAVPDPEGRWLTIAATYGYSRALVEHVQIQPGVGIIGGVFRSGAPLRVRDVSALPDVKRPRPRYRTNSLMAVPIKAAGQVLGVVTVSDREDAQPFSPEDLSALRAHAAPLALALERERMRTQAENMAHAAAVDPVSGLFNRRYFQVRIEEELQRAQRHNMPLALMMIDLDDFKAINDRYGHLAGDTVIRETADIIRRSVRVFDVCTRYGGEEFAVVMPGTGPDSAKAVAERIRRRIEEHRAGEKLELQVTASAGIAVSSPDVGVRELIAQADEALYLAKRAGKNETWIIQPPTP